MTQLIPLIREFYYAGQDEALYGADWCSERSRYEYETRMLVLNLSLSLWCLVHNLSVAGALAHAESGRHERR